MADDLVNLSAAKDQGVVRYVGSNCYLCVL